MRLLAAVDPGGGGLNSKDLGTMLKLNEKGATVGFTYPTIASFLNLLIPTVFVIAGIILLILLIGGGFSIVASGGNAKSVEGGKNQIMSAIIGFVIIFAAYWIIQIVQTFTGVKIFNATL
jgi:hypothetical protein